MNFNEIQMTKPKTEDIQKGVLYISEGKYQIDGLYRFWIVGRAKIGQHSVQGGFYSGNGQLTVTVQKGSGICFDRFPHPLKKSLVPAPVPDIIRDNDNIEMRIAMALQEYEIMKNEGKEPEIDLDELDPDEVMVEDSDMFVSDFYQVNQETGEMNKIDESEILKVPPSSTEELAEGDPPRVGEVPDRAEGEKTANSE